MELNPDYLDRLMQYRIDEAVQAERHRVIKILEDYMELTEFSEASNGADPNPDWSLGFQAALALIKGKEQA
jgi:hypothetical protein